MAAWFDRQSPTVLIWARISPLPYFEEWTLTYACPARIAAMRAGHAYVNVHSSKYGSGEIRAQIRVVDGD